MYKFVKVCYLSLLLSNLNVLYRYKTQYTLILFFMYSKSAVVLIKDFVTACGFITQLYALEFITLFFID